MASTVPTRLDDYLRLLESRHGRAIDMGLQRIRAVAANMGLTRFSCPVITVAGTNGKGSTVATLEALACAHNLKVGVYTSPHLVHFNERIRINGRNISDDELLSAFAMVEAALGEHSLTYFEFTTLAALYCFAQQALDVVVLEVGMGGRLDAVNIIDADVAVLTTVDFDHMSFLGDSLPAIAHEKAGICRAGRPVVIADQQRLDLLRAAAEQQGARIIACGEHYRFGPASEQSWYYQYADEPMLSLGLPQLGADLVAAALTAWQLAGLPRVPAAVEKAVTGASLAGRWQILEHAPLVVLDVAHNPQACARLRERLARVQYRHLHMVVGMLADKEQQASLAAFADLDVHWYLASLPGERGFSAQALARCLPVQTPSEKNSQQCFDTVTAAWQTARAKAAADDMILVFGSFLTVAAVIQASA